MGIAVRRCRWELSARRIESVDGLFKLTPTSAQQIMAGRWSTSKAGCLGICVPMNPQSQAVAAGVEWYDSGIGFAVPVTDFEQIIEQLKDGRRIYPAFMGVQATPNPKGEGLLVNKLVPLSPAAEAGLQEEDVILELNQQPVSDMLRLRQLLTRMQAGDKLTVLVQRGEQEQEFTLELSPPPKSVEAEQNQLEPPKIR